MTKRQARKAARLLWQAQRRVFRVQGYCATRTLLDRCVELRRDLNEFRIDCEDWATREEVKHG